MPREDGRALGRDVFIYDLRDFDTLLGGPVLTAGMTNANFYAMVDIIIDILPPGPFFLQDENGEIIAQHAQPLLPGRYFVVADGTVQKTAEAAFARMMSFQPTRTNNEFRDQVRERDGRCVVTKEENPNKEFEIWDGFDAAHIIPIAYLHQWNVQGWSQQITIPPSQRPYGTINSVQNGLLLDSAIHRMFDSYSFSINPDDGDKIICFQRDRKRIAGTSLDNRLLQDPRRPLDTLLRWHFRQAVLTNMKGAGEPNFEHDFPPGSDMMGEIQSGPKAAERMEFELFNRLANHMLAGVDTDEEDKDEDKHDGNGSDKG
ncbi:hypothetical protein B0H67DRAFT_601200 [Lasiosphaeris hirsuta]|uniref:HNH nuclease domain-containing protein n=1 Tax=Lasiosphaeris hirsuta TaxID=260670 RepID=A0AA40DXX3_9PEZI|nr:hypothetical protein B0H67DRAFT_601200 [Lasiosphaeris hirsuta]